MPSRLIQAATRDEGIASFARFASHFLPGRDLVLSAEEWQDGRSLPQNAVFHAICRDVSAQAQYMGKPRSPDQWKVLFISGHAIATGIEAEVVPGLEGEFLNIRESSARMSKKRMNSLIEYTTAWCVGNGIRLSATPAQEEAANTWGAR